MQWVHTKGTDMRITVLMSIGLFAVLQLTSFAAGLDNEVTAAVHGRYSLIRNEQIQCCVACSTPMFQHDIVCLVMYIWLCQQLSITMRAYLHQVDRLQAKGPNLGSPLSHPP